MKLNYSFFLRVCLRVWRGGDFGKKKDWVKTIKRLGWKDFKSFAFIHNTIVDRWHYYFVGCLFGESLVYQAILRVFELASSFRWIFAKSNLIGVNYDPAFLELACEFLHCELESLPFKYLGLSVGLTPTHILRENLSLISFLEGFTHWDTYICVLGQESNPP